jgi:hypothetical protein
MPEAPSTTSVAGSGGVFGPLSITWTHKFLMNFRRAIPPKPAPVEEIGGSPSTFVPFPTGTDPSTF